MIKNRYYQDRAINKTLDYWENNPGMSPIIDMPTGSGKSVVVGGVIYGAMRKYNTKLRSIVITPSAELCEQNAEKLQLMAPAGISVDVYSASLKRKVSSADIICATIGSVANVTSQLGHRHIIGIDEGHLASVDGKGDYCKFVYGMAKNGPFRLFSLTATPFKGNGVWITQGKNPLFHGFSDKVTIRELLDNGYLSPLVVPKEKIKTKIDTSGIDMSGYDYNTIQLAKRTAKYLYNCARESIDICYAYNRKKWIAFLPDVETANDFGKILNSMGVSAAVVIGDMDTKERRFIIEQYRKGYITCIITVIALTTGFDVPDIDALIWLRSTVSPVLYVQGAGRGFRIAEGKLNCLWLDFTDTTERLGPVDRIKGRGKKRKTDMHAPCIICDNCGDSIRPASTIFCPSCGYEMRKIDDLQERGVSIHDIMANEDMEPVLPVTKIDIRPMTTGAGKRYIMVHFFNGIVEICKEPIFFSGVTISPSCAEFWLMITGDYKGQYNNYTSCYSFISEQARISQSMGVRAVRIKRKLSKNEFDKVIEVIRE